HSLGAAVAVTYAVTHPARVERLALVGGVVPGFGYRPSWVYRLVALPLIGEALARCGSAALYKAALARASAAVRAANPKSTKKSTSSRTGRWKQRASAAL